MKILLIIFLITIISCQNKPKEYTVTQAQKSLDSIMTSYFDLYNQSPNEATKEDLKEKTLETVNHYLAEKLHNKLDGFKVRTEPISRYPSYHISFTDRSQKKYDQLKGIKYIAVLDDTSNQTFQFIKTLREGNDTTLSFQYLGQLEWEAGGDKELLLKVIPFPTNL